MSLGLVSEFPREDTPGLPVWARPLLSHFQEGGRGSRGTSLTSRWEQSVINTHTCCGLQSSRHRKRERRVVPRHLLCAGPWAQPWVRRREVGGLRFLEFSVRSVTATGAHHPTSCLPCLVAMSCSSGAL